MRRTLKNPLFLATLTGDQLHRKRRSLAKATKVRNAVRQEVCDLLALARAALAGFDAGPYVPYRKD